MNYTVEEVAYILENFERDGPKKVGERLGRSMKVISRKARRLGLFRGASKSSSERKNHWTFDEWDYHLGYLVGVYLGDGNVWNKANFRLFTIDEDFARTTASKVKRLTGYEASVKYYDSRAQWVMSFCNVDFARWMVGSFGPANGKIIKVLPSIEANKGMLEGLFDSEGTAQQYSLSIRMYGDLTPIDTICTALSIKHGGRFKGISQQRWCNRKRGEETEYLSGYTISISEWNRAGLGTYISRKSKNGIRLKYE
jgi:hypothetical protein